MGHSPTEGAAPDGALSNGRGSTGWGTLQRKGQHRMGHSPCHVDAWGSGPIGQGGRPCAMPRPVPYPISHMEHGSMIGAAHVAHPMPYPLSSIHCAWRTAHLGQHLGRRKAACRHDTLPPRYPAATIPCRHDTGCRLASPQGRASCPRAARQEAAYAAGRYRYLDRAGSAGGRCAVSGPACLARCLARPGASGLGQAAWASIQSGAPQAYPGTATAPAQRLPRHSDCPGTALPRRPWHASPPAR